jgi:sodium transport system permease protein
MKNIWTVMRKEFARFFYDKRMIVMVLIPGLLIYLVYSFMGTAMDAAFSADDEFKPWVHAVSLPPSISTIMQAADISIFHTSESDIPNIKETISAQQNNVLMVFPHMFDVQVETFWEREGPAPNIEIYFNSTVPNSTATYTMVLTILDIYKNTIANVFEINSGIINNDLATQQDITASIISTMMPMLLMIFLYSGCMGLALESITGEKERGTLATLLVSPLKRRELAIGKILSLAALSFISGCVTAVATILALPNLMAGAGDALDASIYGVVDYALLAIVILSVLLLMVALISIISAFSKTVKEAGTAVMPLMIIVMLVGVSGMFGGGAQEDSVYYLIPLYSSVQSMTGIFALEYNVSNILISCLSSTLYAGIGGYVLTRMFNSEKVMFSR